METDEYIIHGGVEGRERLRILSRVFGPSTRAFLKRAGLREGHSVLEIGCGGGDVACELARLVGPKGRVLATDSDSAVLEIAGQEARALGLANVEFRRSDISREIPEGSFDFVYARFVLTHLSDPLGALLRMKPALKPGGVLAIEDIDFRGHFCEPECPAMHRYVELYTEAVRLRGGDANIGARLPELVAAAGFVPVHASVAHPAGRDNDIKLMNPITMEAISPAVLRAGLAGEEEIASIVQALYDFARMPGAAVGLPRVTQVWAIC